MGNNRREQFKDMLDSVFKTEVIMFKAWYHRLMRKLCGKIAIKCMAKVSRHKNREYDLRMQADNIFDWYAEKYCK